MRVGSKTEPLASEMPSEAPQLDPGGPPQSESGHLEHGEPEQPEPRKPDGRAVEVDDPYDVALVVVHGMGNAYTSQILLEWSEPLLERIDWLTRDRAIFPPPAPSPPSTSSEPSDDSTEDPDPAATKGYGVTVLDSKLSGDIPVVTAEVGVPDADAPGERRRIRLAIVEARWSESFVPMSRRQVFRWAVSFLWRAVGRMLVQFWRTIVRIPYLTMRSHARSRASFVEVATGFFIDPLRFAFGIVVAPILTAVVLAFTVVGTILLPLLSPLLLIPWFKDKAQAAIDGLIDSIGDVAAWKQRPLRAAAMRVVVREALDRAARFVGVDPKEERARRDRGEQPSERTPSGRPFGQVHVLAHSQGAAVAAYALFSDDIHPADYRVTRLTTVGAAVVLLGRDRWKGRSSVYQPVRAWRSRAPEVTWENFWAIWDPFSAGPIADDETGARSRWQDAYFPERHYVRASRASKGSTAAAGTGRRSADERAAAPEGPAEHAVHNTSQPFLDHSMYFDNVLQVVEPTARALLLGSVPEPDPQVTYVTNRLMVIDKKSLGVNFVLSFVIAAMIPGLEAVSIALAWLATAIASGISWLFGLLPFIQAKSFDAVASSSFLIDTSKDPDELSGWGWAVASVLVLALLIWLNQVLAGATSRAIAWTRCPRNPWRWLLASSSVRAGYTIAAVLSVWYLIVERSGYGETWLFLLLVFVGFLIFWEPFVARVPRVVEANPRPSEPPSASASSAPAVAVMPDAVMTDLESNDVNPVGGAGHATEWPKRYTLIGSVRSPAFKDDFSARIALRRVVQGEQDARDEVHAKTAGIGWKVRRELRREVRPLDDWFFRPDPKVGSPSEQVASPSRR